MPQEQDDGGDFAEIAPEYERVFEKAVPYLQTRDNEVHTRISYGYALRMLEEGGDPGVVLPAVLLHDIGWSRVPEDLQLSAIGTSATNPELRDVHEAEGAEMARGILSELGFEDEATQKIVRIISGHDSRLTAESLEDAIVKDCDKLFRFSAKGFRIIVRWYGFDPQVLVQRLEGFILDWFLTPLGTRLAREEVAARRTELETSRDS